MEPTFRRLTTLSGGGLGFRHRRTVRGTKSDSRQSPFMLAVEIRGGRMGEGTVYRWPCDRLITVARDRSRLLCFGRVIYFFPSTDFSTSLGRFLRNFATRRGMSRNSLSPIGVFIRARNKFDGRKTQIFADLRTQNRHFEPRHSLMRAK